MSEQNPWARPAEEQDPGATPAAGPEPEPTVNLAKPAPRFAAPDGAAPPLPVAITEPGVQPPAAAPPTGYFTPGAPPPGAQPYPQYPPQPPHSGSQPYPGQQPPMPPPPPPPPPGYGAAPAAIYGDPGFGASSAGAAAPYTLDAYGMPVPARTDPMAATSLGLGIVSIALNLFTCCCGWWWIGFAWVVLGLAAAGLGFAAMRHIDAAPALRSGRSLAIGGMATGGVGVLIAVVVMVLVAALGNLAG